MSRRVWLAGLAFALMAPVACGGDDRPPLVFDKPVETSVAPTTSAVAPSTSSTPPRTADAGPASSSTIAPTVSPPVVTEPSPLGDSFLLGANLPWYNFGCDFGCGPDGGGASSTEVTTAVGDALAAARGAGLSLVRWWMFPGTPTQFTTDPAGLPDGIDPVVFQDIDAALALGAQHDVSFIFTLFSSPTAIPAEWLTTEEGRQRLVDVLGELFVRYRDEPRIHTWQVINEPEWEIWGGDVELADVQDLVRRISRSVHDNSSALVSVGGARLDGLEMWNGLDLDYRTVHWYDYMTGDWECVPCTTYDELVATRDIDGPVLVGELNLNPDIDGLARLTELRDGGWAGALAWSLLADRTQDRLGVNLAAVESFLGGGG